MDKVKKGVIGLLALTEIAIIVICFIYAFQVVTSGFNEITDAASYAAWKESHSPTIVWLCAPENRFLCLLIVFFPPLILLGLDAAIYGIIMKVKEKKTLASQNE